jgi:hypothetical protein
MGIASAAFTLAIGAIGALVCWKGFRLAIRIVSHMFDELGEWFEKIV